MPHDMTRYFTSRKPRPAFRHWAMVGGGLCRPTIAFNPQGPCLRLGSIRLTDGLRSPFAGVFDIELGRADTATPDHLAGLRAAHGGRLRRQLRRSARPLASVPQFQTIGGIATAKPHGMHLNMLALGFTPLFGSDPISMSCQPHLLQNGASVC
jgi:hypothetical protein